MIALWTVSPAYSSGKVYLLIVMLAIAGSEISLSFTSELSLLWATPVSVNEFVASPKPNICTFENLTSTQAIRWKESLGYLAPVEYIGRELVKIHNLLLPMWSATTQFVPGCRMC
jgi:hypothetical protein